MDATVKTEQTKTSRIGRPWLGEHEPGSSDVVMARARAKLRKEQADARRAELAAAEDEGLVVPRSELDAILGRVAAGIRRVITAAPAMIDTIGLDPADADRLRPVLIRTVEQIRLLIARQIEQGEQPVVEVTGE